MYIVPKNTLTRFCVTYLGSAAGYTAIYLPCLTIWNANSFCIIKADQSKNTVGHTSDLGSVQTLEQPVNQNGRFSAAPFSVEGKDNKSKYNETVF